MKIPLAKRVKVFPNSLQIPLRKCMKLIAFLARNCLQTALGKGERLFFVARGCRATSHPFHQRVEGGGLKAHQWYFHGR